MELRSILNQYKEISLKLIKSIEDDDSNGELLIKEREDLIDKLKIMDYSKDDFKKISEELELVKIEKKITNSIVVLREDIKKEMLELKAKRNAGRTYGNIFRNINFINEKI